MTNLLPETIIEEIKRAVKALGYKGCRVCVGWAGFNRYRVWVEKPPHPAADVDLGVYDADKHTFVD